jgi:hypothetical protein
MNIDGNTTNMITITRKIGSLLKTQDQIRVKNTVTTNNRDMNRTEEILDKDNIKTKRTSMFLLIKWEILTNLMILVLHSIL